MNDLEICKRIAEIEGIKETHWDAEGRSFYSNPKHIAQGMKGYWGEYNPITDDALCFKLLVKYELSLIAPEGDQTNWDCVISDILNCDENPNRAICLAIIELNKG